MINNKTISQKLVERTFRELARPKPLQARSRVWEDPKGYQYLGAWSQYHLAASGGLEVRDPEVVSRDYRGNILLGQNAALLRVLVRVATLGLPKSEYRLKAQMDDEARSVKRNIEEGWKRPTTSEYLQFLGYSQGSLEELRGDIRDCKTDGLLKSVPGSTLKDKGFDLRVTKGPSKSQVKGEPTEPTHPYYKPLNTLNPETLTYEVFLELINKTDYLLRLLVRSLEKKLAEDKKYYQVEKARIRDKLKPK